MLTEAQIKAREGKLTGSRIKCLMNGVSHEILQLYNEMIGEAVPEDLRHVWPVRLGEATETLQCDWYEECNGHTVTRRGDVVVHPHFSWAAVTLDGWIEQLNCPLEVKHCGGREPLEVVVDRYQPQMQWQLFVTGAEMCALSVVMGANAPIVEFIERADDYILEMFKRGEQFMGCVHRREPPVALDAVPPPVDASKIYDMSLNNHWCSYAGQWLETRDAAEKCKSAEKVLKSIVPEDAKKCHGANVSITRDRAGRLSLRELVIA